MTKGRLYYVKWSDASGVQAEWVPIRKLRRTARPTTVESVGWLLKNTKEYIVILPHRSPGPPSQGLGEMSIPKHAILKQRRLN